MAFSFTETATELANLALEALGETKRLSNVETDQGTVARTLQANFWPAFDETLAGYPWNCARKRVRLGALALAPPFGFTSYYQLPSDFLGVQEIDGALEGDQWAVEVAGEPGAEIPVIATDIPAPLDLVYTYAMRNLALATPSLKGAFIHGLAFRSAMGVTGDGRKRDDQFAIWKDMLSVGQRADGRMMSKRRPPDSEILTVRG